MSSTLSKVSKKVRKDEETRKGLDKLEKQLKNGELHAGRGAKKLPGTTTVFYMRSGGEASFDDQCPVSTEQKSKEPSTHHDDFTQKSKKKKKWNQHLNRQIDVNGENFEFERDQIEKKAPSHGPEFGLEPDYGPDGKIIRDRKTGKPRAKQNKENYKKFADNLEEFAKDPNSERIEPQYRKGRENEQDAVGFLNRKDKRFIIFDRHTKKYITGWVMNDLQYQEFIENNNII